MRPPFDKIDWRAQWLAPLRPLGVAVAASADWRSALGDIAARHAVKNHRGMPIRFVPQSDLPAGVEYERYISESGCVPTRDNLHDFFNALIWLLYPDTKRELNALQAVEIARLQPMKDGLPVSVRGAKRDAATLFDENAAIVIVRSGPVGNSIAERLRQHHWIELFLNHRQEFTCHCSVFLFGHALIEKLVAPYKAITAHAVIIDGEDSFFESNAACAISHIDCMLKSQLQNDSLATSMFTPLPVLGVPGWHDIQNMAFYADTNVYRPKRRNR